MLVWFEEFADVREAIQREKTLKHYTRAWKINLIERTNPHWVDLYPTLPALRRSPPATASPSASGQPEDDTAKTRPRALRPQAISAQTTAHLPQARFQPIQSAMPWPMISALSASLSQG